MAWARPAPASQLRAARTTRFCLAGVMLAAITACNLLALWWLDRRSPPTHEASDGKMPSKLHLL